MKLQAPKLIKINIAFVFLYKSSMFKYNPYTLRREKTMYLSTLGQRKSKRFFRQSSFQKHDIQGSSPRRLIPKQINKKDYSLSTEIEPIPNRAKNISKQSNPLFVGDIQGAKAKNKDFKTKRVVNPLNPAYVLPSASAISLDPGRKFIRDTLQTDDINMKKSYQTHSCERIKSPIQGSTPAKLIREVKAISRLNVNDITKLDRFRTIDPLHSFKASNGRNEETKNIFPFERKRPNLCLNITDIQGTQNTSFFSKFHHIDKRKEFKTFLKNQELESSSVPPQSQKAKALRCRNPLSFEGQ